MSPVQFQKALLCIVEGNSLISKIADEILKFRANKPHSLAGLSSGFNRIASRLESIATDGKNEKFNWSLEEKDTLIALLSCTLKSEDPHIAVVASKVLSLFFPEGIDDDKG